MPTRTSVSWKVTARLFVALLLCSTLLASAKQKPLTNDDIIKMTKAGLDEDVIVGTMQSNANAFDLSPDGLISLKKGGVSSKVLHTMQSLAKADKDSGPAPVSASSPAAKAGSNKKVKVLPAKSSSPAGDLTIVTIKKIIVIPNPRQRTRAVFSA